MRLSVRAILRGRRRIPWRKLEQKAFLRRAATVAVAIGLWLGTGGISASTAWVEGTGNGFGAVHWYTAEAEAAFEPAECIAKTPSDTRKGFPIGISLCGVFPRRP